MLHRTVNLANLQVHCSTRDPELNKIAGQVRNLFYAASLPWCDGNLGRVIPKLTYDEFYEEYEGLRERFYKLKPPAAEHLRIAFASIPFPALNKLDDTLQKAPQLISHELDERFKRRITMLQDALEQEKRFYGSLLTELEKIVEIGLYLKKSLDPNLVSRLKLARDTILVYTVKDVRQLTSVRDDILNRCGECL